MKNNETCAHDGVAPVALLDMLHRSQGGPGRHKCTVCAYEQGFLLGSSRRWNNYANFCDEIGELNTCKAGISAPARVLASLDVDQAGSGRHKCTNCAFKEGFAIGLGEKGPHGADGSVPKLKLVDAPSKGLSTGVHKGYSKGKADFLQMEIHNKKLGDLGEQFVFKYEVNCLIAAGKPDLASQVRHVSTEDDGLGYDIHSYDVDGNEKLIEVKTTRGSKSRAFYITSNELTASKNLAENYFLYRVFDFDCQLDKAKYYVLAGDLSLSLTLYPKVFMAFPKATQ